ncbi:hypothetical protein [Mesorhizobium sp. IMUNJ 23232]|uniref:hypothetical protein n=1 Tax=Mesorhizobium sp. IMUNJ 23232 TaxID=3376064 RepID=UPI0037BB0431
MEYIPAWEVCGLAFACEWVLRCVAGTRSPRVQKWQPSMDEGFGSDRPEGNPQRTCSQQADPVRHVPPLPASNLCEPPHTLLRVLRSGKHAELDETADSVDETAPFDEQKR